MAQYDIRTLLEQAGARPRGNRHDCPKCGGLRTITRTDECFYCHKCGWKGNAVTLGKELGMYRRLPSAEYLELRQRSEQAERSAADLYERVKTRRFELYDELHSLNRVEVGAHARPDHPAVWDAFALVYRQRPAILAELTFLENAHARAITRFLAATPEEQQALIDRVLEHGGLCDSKGKFVELTL